LGAGARPFVIAEAGVNYENSMATAERMVREAALAGADAIKFQTYKAERLAAADSPAYWAASTTQREYFRNYDSFGRKEYEQLADLCAEVGIVFLSTPFDEEALDYLTPLMPAIKIASADITNWPLLRRACATGKPLLLSTGASLMSEIAAAVELCRENGVVDLALLHCILHYPAEYGEANLRAIEYLGVTFPDCVIGYSDHTKPDAGMAVVTAAAVLGASIIEKHFTLDKTLPGNDHYHAMDPADLRRFADNLATVWQAFGRAARDLAPGERQARQYARRSVVARGQIPEGASIRPDQVTVKRPGTGIPANQIDLVIGRTAKRAIADDTILSWEMIG